MAVRTTRRNLLQAAAAVPLATATGCQLRDGLDDAGGAKSPFTGERSARGRVLTVKIDNIPSARPHTGLEHAGIVYAEQVEAGLSRLLAVYSADLPRLVGPVRSARESDLELLRQFGRPTLAYSGVQSKLQPALDAAPLTPVTPERTASAFERSSERSSPHNLFLRPRAALHAAPRTAAPSDIGFRFGAAPGGGKPATHRSARFPDARFDFTWSTRHGRWLVSMDGSPARTDRGGQLGATTVVLQQVRVRDSRLHDVNGELTPYTETVGTGRATVLRDGRAYDGHWARPSPDSGTVFTDPAGNRLRFAPGPVWVVLTPSR